MTFVTLTVYVFMYSSCGFSFPVESITSFVRRIFQDSFVAISANFGLFVLSPRPRADGYSAACFVQCFVCFVVRVRNIHSPPISMSATIATTTSA